MNKIPFLLLLVFTLLLSACNTGIKNEKNSNSLTSETSYLGQKPPRLKAEVFAPGISTTEHMEFFGRFKRVLF